MATGNPRQSQSHLATNSYNHRLSESTTHLHSNPGLSISLLQTLVVDFPDYREPHFYIAVAMICKAIAEEGMFMEEVLEEADWRLLQAEGGMLRYSGGKLRALVAAYLGNFGAGYMLLSQAVLHNPEAVSDDYRLLGIFSAGSNDLHKALT
jgi:hypothetical protein